MLLCVLRKLLVTLKAYASHYVLEYEGKIMIRDYDIEQMKKHTCCPTCDKAILLHFMLIIMSQTLTHDCVISTDRRSIASSRHTHVHYFLNHTEKIYIQMLLISIDRKLKTFKPVDKQSQGKETDAKKEAS